MPGVEVGVKAGGTGIAVPPAPGAEADGLEDSAGGGSLAGAEAASGSVASEACSLSPAASRGTFSIIPSRPRRHETVDAVRVHASRLA